MTNEQKKPFRVQRPKHIEGDFNRIALEIAKYHLVTSQRRYRIVEVEFYFTHPNHPDPFGHCHPLQQAFLTWHLHRGGPKATHPSFGHMRAGIDLTFGGDGFFGGILLRGLSFPGLESKPLLLLKRLLWEAMGEWSRGALHELDARLAGKSAFDTTSPLHLLRAERSEWGWVKTKPSRTGLSDKTRPRKVAWMGVATVRKLRTKFIARPYKYILQYP